MIWKDMIALRRMCQRRLAQSAQIRREEPTGLPVHDYGVYNVSTILPRVDGNFE